MRKRERAKESEHRKEKRKRNGAENQRKKRTRRFDSFAVFFCLLFVQYISMESSFQYRHARYTHIERLNRKMHTTVIEQLVLVKKKLFGISALFHFLEIFLLFFTWAQFLNDTWTTLENAFGQSVAERNHCCCFFFLLFLTSYLLMSPLLIFVTLLIEKICYLCACACIHVRTSVFKPMKSKLFDS